MKRNHSTLVLSDGSNTGHTKQIQDEFIKNNITLYPLSRSKKNGYPPSSHDIMALENTFSE